MECDLCGLLLQKKLFICKGCEIVFNLKEKMCESCKEEHIEANDGISEFVEVTNWQNIIIVKNAHVYLK